MAFFSGLFFTANNFIIKAARLSFGELLAVRSLIQIPLVSLILFMKGTAVFIPIFKFTMGIFKVIYCDS